MLVNVVRLCRLGETLPPDELETAARVRGHLFLARWHRGEVRVNGEAAGLIYEASLHRADDNRLPHLLPALQEAFVSKIKHDGLMITGVEIGSAHAPDARYRQTWWCRLAGQPR